MEKHDKVRSALQKLEFYSHGIVKGIWRKVGMDILCGHSWPISDEKKLLVPTIGIINFWV